MNTQRAAIDELVDTLTPALGGRHLADDVYSLHVVCAARSYPYLDSMAPATRRMLEAIKGTVDPACLLNPGALGLG